MVLAVNYFNNAAKVIADIQRGAVTVTAYRLSLTNTAPVASQTDFDEAVAHPKPASFGGYPSGGYTLSGLSSTTLNTRDASMQASKQVSTASGTDIGPYRYILVHVQLSGGLDKVLWWWDRGSSQTTTAGGSRTFRFAGVDGVGDLMQLLAV